MHSTLAELRTEIANAKKVSSSKARLKGDYGAYLGEICTTLEGKLFCSVCSEFAAGSGLEPEERSAGSPARRRSLAAAPDAAPAEAPVADPAPNRFAFSDD